MKPDYDIAINGAGMVGAALACALGDSGLSVVVIEPREPVLNWPEGSLDLRVSAITAASEQVFRHLDTWSAMVERGVCPFRDMEVWDAGGSGSIHFDAADIGQAQLGHVIENRVIQAALLERLRGLDNIDLLTPAQLESATVTENQVQLQLDNSQSVTTRLLVGADGGNSRVRSEAGIATQGWNYQQRAIVANVETELPHQNCAWQRFLSSGPLAFLPLASGHSAIVWSTTTEQADALLAMDEAEFKTVLGQAFEHRLGQIISSSERAAFPLRLQHARQYVQHRIALVGDAAHTIHPLAGQGVNLGLLDAAALAEVINDANRAGKDIGKQHVLRRYERWRKGDNLLIMGIMDGFKRLFGTGNAPLRWLRNSGLSLTDATTPVKNMIMLRAMGLKGDLPSLARNNSY